MIQSRGSSVERNTYIIGRKVVLLGLFEFVEDGADVLFEIPKIFCLWTNEVGAHSLVRLILHDTACFDGGYSGSHGQYLQVYCAQMARMII
jgi:hypothetical protein